MREKGCVVYKKITGEKSYRRINRLFDCAVAKLFQSGCCVDPGNAIRVEIRTCNEHGLEKDLDGCRLLYSTDKRTIARVEQWINENSSADEPNLYERRLFNDALFTVDVSEHTLRNSPKATNKDYLIALSQETQFYRISVGFCSFYVDAADLYTDLRWIMPQDNILKEHNKGVSILKENVRIGLLNSEYLTLHQYDRDELGTAKRQLEFLYSVLKEHLGEY